MTEREHGHGEGREPLDEEAAWAQIVAGYGEEPADPPGWEKPSADDKPADPAEDRDSAGRDSGADEPSGGLAVADTPTPDPAGAGSPAADDDAPRSGGEHSAHGDQGTKSEESGAGRTADTAEDGDQPVNDADQPIRTFTVYAAGTGPRDFSLAEPPEEEDHFVPPEPPPLPKLEPQAKLAWIAVLGGPAVLFSAVLLQIPINWWMITLGVGGFLGGFGTLVYRMNDGYDDDGYDDPGRGAVV